VCSKIAPGISAENGLAAHGDQIEAHAMAEPPAICAGGRRGANAREVRSLAKRGFVEGF
jgi:hypothetical protein